jgi:hypothetical protein
VPDAGRKRDVPPRQQARYDELVRTGVVVPADVPKRRGGLPEPVRVPGGLSDLVIADRA